MRLPLTFVIWMVVVNHVLDTAREYQTDDMALQELHMRDHRKCLIKEEIKMTGYLTRTGDLILYSNGCLLWKKVKITKTLKTENNQF